jgi:RsiW-degrading membrane proteinase PrsW (M82 family)
LPISYFSEILILSFLLSSFMLLFRPNMISIIIGGSVVSFFAIIIESYMQVITSGIFVLIIISPVTEEILKFLGTVFGKSVRNAIGVGLGFAVVENAFYIMLILSTYSLQAAFWYLIARSIGDPLLHSSSTSISVKSWEGRRLALPSAIGLHFSYNLWAVMLSSSPPLFKFEPIVIILLFSLLMQRSGKLGDIRLRWKVHPSVGGGMK